MFNVIRFNFQGLDHSSHGTGIKSPFLSSSSGGSSRTTGRSSSGGSRSTQQHPPKLPSEPPGTRLRGGGQQLPGARGEAENNYMLPMDSRQPGGQMVANGGGWDTLGATPTGLLETRIPTARDAHAQYGKISN